MPDGVRHQPEPLQGGADLARLRSDLKAEAARADKESARAAAAEIEVRRLTSRVRSLSRRNFNLEALRDRLENEYSVLEEELSSLLTRGVSEGDGDAFAETGGRDRAKLHGWRVLYVGGRSHLVPHYRALVEQHGGEFYHHDGGQETTLKCLQSKLAGADVVVCPVDCVSHAACYRIKQTCKRLSRPFVMMRSSGLSTFARELQAMAQ